MKTKLFGVLMLGIFIALPQKSQAVLVDADDLIGQIDENSNPIWTQSIANNGTGDEWDLPPGTISDAGINGSGNLGNGIVMDKINHRLFLNFLTYCF